MDDLADAFSDGYEDGWDTAMYIYGLHDCTVRNSGEKLIHIPLKGHVCYIELEPGEEVSLRTVE